MRVLYDSTSLKRLCTDEREMNRRRADIARKLQLRIKALEAAPTLGALVTSDPLGRWHRLTGDLSGHWAGWVSRNHRVIIRPEGAVPDVAAVTITVIEAGTDYH